MRTIGSLIQEARQRENYSHKVLERKTKIKESFIKAIEQEEWSKLPEYPVVVGFVKNISSALGIDRQVALALLRRDYPPRSLPINPKPDVFRSFSWSPKFTLAIAVSFFALIIFYYLFSQYRQFNSPPSLTLSRPTEGEMVDNEFIVSGITAPEATITVNNQPILVGEDGSFVVEMVVSDDETEVIVVAKSRSGKETSVRRKIEVVDKN